MIRFHNFNNIIEEKLRQTADFMPEPTRGLLISDVMEERQKDRENTAPYKQWHMPDWRTAVIVLFILAAGSTTALAASPKLRDAIARFFSFGTVEEIPVDELEKDMTEQAKGSLTFIQDVTLDPHFSAAYASSSDFLSLVTTSSGMPLFCTQSEKGETVYYSFEGGILKELALDTRRLTVLVQPDKLPGIMSYGGEAADYSNLALPPVELTISWKQYGSEILIDDMESTERFGIGDMHDGQCYFKTLRGQSEIVEVCFILDGQHTAYEYPFLLNLTTGEVSDPLSDIDFSAWPCITELSIDGDLHTATAMAGSSYNDLQKITIDLTTGKITASPKFSGKVPADNYIFSFPVGSSKLFYTTGTEESSSGYIYDAETEKSKLLFTDTAAYSMWGGVSASRYWEDIGYGYIIYFENDSVSLINLNEGGLKTKLEGIPVSPDVSFFMNDEGTILSISVREEGSFNTAKLCLLNLKTMKAWYFERNLPSETEEWMNYWNSEYEYVIEAQNEETKTNYIYLYQYTP